MPEVQAVVIGSVPLACVALYFVGRLIWQEISHRSVKPALAAAHLLTGAGSIWNHPVFIALACSRIYAPNLLMETLYNGALQTICLFFVRLASVLLCLALWNHLYTTGHSNVNSYVKCRYRSAWINFLYNANTLFGFSYLITLESGPTAYAFVDFQVADRLMPFLIIFWLLLTSLGGFEITMLALTVIWLIEILGHVAAALKLPKFQLMEPAVDTFKVNACLSNLGLPSFVIIFFQMMTVLPFYRLYRAAGTRARGNFAIALSIITRAVHSIGSANFRGNLFYLPLLPTILTVTVGTFLVLGLMQKILKDTVVVPMTVIQLLVSNKEDFVAHREIWSKDFENMSNSWMCGVTWFPTMLALFFALVMMILAIMLQVPTTGHLEEFAGEGKAKDDEETEGDDEGMEVNVDRSVAGSVGDFLKDA
ncbi:unnamed protein product [Dibothriocephalus latus]|uniref:Uncharacterized protein n=1 Tax=Dibothriocephalus latus TaxID=60516 RepID=A0A3P7LMF4_DIBLA|nr:unnamed protein product [Dibothriocephalus latus]